MSGNRSWMHEQVIKIQRRECSRDRATYLQGPKSHSGSLFKGSWPKKTRVSPCMPPCELISRLLRLYVSKTSLSARIALHGMNLASELVILDILDIEGWSWKETHHFHPALGRTASRWVVIGVPWNYLDHRVSTQHTPVLNSETLLYTGQQVANAFGWGYWSCMCGDEATHH